MSLFLAEMRKIWVNRTFLLLVAVLAFANLLLLWMGTRPAANQPSAAAYRTAAQQLSGLSMEEKGTLLHARCSDAESLLKIEQFYRESAAGSPYWTGYREQHRELFEEYEQRYLEHDYTVLTGSLSGDYLLYQQLMGEYDVVSGYPAFLEEVRTKAVRLSGLSIFQTQQSDYERKSIQKAAQAYARLDTVNIDYYPQKGIYTALSYPFTDLVLLAASLLLAFLMVRQERDNGLLGLIRALPGGRLKTAAAKLAVFAVSLAAVLLLLYGVNLLYCGVSFGLGPLSRSIQSVPALMRCTMQITVGQYFCLFLMAKWAGTFVMGLWVMLAVLVARHALVGWIGALALPAAMYGIRWAIPATSRLNVIKYANLASLLQTNELLGIYQNLYWFGSPVPLHWVEWMAAIVFGLVFGVSFCLVFTWAQLLPSPVHPAVLRLSRRTHATTVFWEEGKKLFWMNGAAIILIFFLMFSLYQTAASENYLDVDEIYYAYYMKQLSGPWTAENAARMIYFKQEFQPMLQVQQKVSAGELSEYALTEYAPLQRKYQIYTQIIQNNINGYLKEHPGAWLVYETGYRKLFGRVGTVDRSDTIYAGLLCAFCFSGLFAMERKSGLDILLRAAPLGQKKTVYMKLLQGSIAAVIIALGTSLPHLWEIIRDYGLPALLAPAMSLSDFENIPQWITLSDLLVFWLICRIAACIGMGVIALWIGQKTGNPLTACFLSAVSFCLPCLLAMSGMENGIEWLGFFPLFHAVSLCAVQGVSDSGLPYSYSWVVWLLLFLDVAGVWAAAESLLLAYDGP